LAEAGIWNPLLAAVQAQADAAGQLNWDPILSMAP